MSNVLKAMVFPRRWYPLALYGVSRLDNHVELRFHREDMHYIAVQLTCQEAVSLSRQLLAACRTPTK
jgi:hypothetical protein